MEKEDHTPKDYKAVAERYEAESQRVFILNCQQANELARLRADNERLLARTIEVERENADVHDDLAKLVSENERHLARITHLSDAMADDAHDLAVLRADNERLRAALADLVDWVNRKQGRAGTLQEVMDRAERELTERKVTP